MDIVRTPLTFPLNTITRNDSEKYDQIFIDFLNDLESNALAHRRFIHQMDIPVPASFEGKKQWASYLSPVKNQGSCGGCYAFAAVSALSDRYNLRSRGAVHLNLSATRVLECDSLGESPNTYAVGSEAKTAASLKQAMATLGCHGNTLLEAWRFLLNLGSNTVECAPEVPIADSCYDLVGRFFDTCEALSTPTRRVPAIFYRATHIYVVPGVPRDGGSERTIRQNIFRYGPLSTAMDIHENFYTFNPKKEIYMRPHGEKVGGHAIVIDGWGEENGTPFWWVRNSWGKEWGIGGYFKILRGANCCHVEENIIVGAPVLDPFVSNLDMAESQVRLLFLPMSMRIRRALTSTYVPNGGIDPRTSISRRYLSLERTADIPELREGIPFADVNSFVAGHLGRSSPATLRILLVLGFCLLVFIAVVLFWNK